MTAAARPLAPLTTVASALAGVARSAAASGVGQRTARRNAWEAVCRDRLRARARAEALAELDRAAAGAVIDAAARPA